ncbi:hypothetical protein [Amycolatopsis plumensis]|uniref:Uncharacterized protein n=1 Tax=Amycolatopsis plumensis TaxID=236508 RepID=A0ABV5U8F9_9PSEU
MLDTLTVCPVDGCDWRMLESEIQFEADRSFGPTLEDAINAMARGRASALERHIRAHLATHDLTDFVRTIRRLEQDLYNAGPTGIRPHAVEQQPTTP